MINLIDFFALSTGGDSPIGLKAFETTEKLNQPALEEQKQVNFNYLFQQDLCFSLATPSNNDLPENDCGIKWLSKINTISK
ncbi:MAG: hypothetical protein AB1782_03025 [Cyanobacteriota bacterium]